MLKKLLVCSAMIWAGAAASVSAATVNLGYSFTVSGTPVSDEVLSASGSFDITFETIAGNGVNVGTFNDFGLTVNYRDGDVRVFDLSDVDLVGSTIRNGRVTSGPDVEFSVFIGGTAYGGAGAFGPGRDSFLIQLADQGPRVGDLFGPAFRFGNQSVQATSASINDGLFTRSSGTIDGQPLPLDVLAAEVPIPGAVLLLLSGLTGLVGLRRIKRSA